MFFFSKETAQQIAEFESLFFFLCEQSRSNCFRLLVVIGCNSCLIFPLFVGSWETFKWHHILRFASVFFLLLFDNPLSFCPFLILNTCFFLKKAFGRSFVEAIFRWRHFIFVLCRSSPYCLRFSIAQRYNQDETEVFICLANSNHEQLLPPR